MEELCLFILKTLNNVYSCGTSVLKSFSIDTESSGDDPNPSILETPPGAERKRPAAVNHGVMFCVAGEICVNTPSMVSDSDPVCSMCNKISHAICIVADEEKEGNIACYVDEEF